MTFNAQHHQEDARPEPILEIEKGKGTMAGLYTSAGKQPAGG